MMRPEHAYIMVNASGIDCKPASAAVGNISLCHAERMRDDACAGATLNYTFAPANCLVYAAFSAI